MAALQRCERFIQWWIACLLIQLQRIFEPLGKTLRSTKALRGSERAERGALASHRVLFGLEGKGQCAIYVTNLDQAVLVTVSIGDPLN